MTASDSYFERAKAVIPGGVNSPVRSFQSVGGTPVFMARAQGAFLWDTSGREYIDCIGSWGPMILGHGNQQVIQAVQQQLELALSFGAPTEQETRLAEVICRMVPSVDLVRMVNSGTEASMSAIRLARGYTRRDYIIKFAGCYHGHVDALLVKAGSGALTAGVPDSGGVPKSFTRHTLIARYNDPEQVKSLFRRYGDEIAAVIVEPIAGNMGCVLPEPGFLSSLEDLCTHYGSLLIFDEVMTGFRVHPAGAQGLYGCRPDLTVFGKIIGGGLPVGAFGGRQDIMSHLAPEGSVYQAGTLSGNPVAMTAGLATLEQLQKEGVYAALTDRTHQLVTGLRLAAERHQIPFSASCVCGMFGLFFTQADKVTDYESVQSTDIGLFRSFFHYMLEAGIYLAPSPFESGFLSTAHDSEIVMRILEASDEAFGKLRKKKEKADNG